MQQRSSKQTEQKTPENPRVTAVKRILNIAELVRQRGTPEEAEEAIQWEKQLQKRLEEIQGGQQLASMA